MSLKPFVRQSVATGIAEVPGPEDAERIGVLFVHGIGSQEQSSTLREFSQPLIDWLRAWHVAHGEPGFRVASSDLSYGGDLDGPARITLEIPSWSVDEDAYPDQRWVLAEAWWATRLAAPELRRVLVWSARILGRTIGRLASEVGTRVAALARRELGGEATVAWSDIGRFGAFIELLSGVLLLVGYAIGGVLGYLLLPLLYALALIPIDAVREFILLRVIRPFLTENIGDFETFVDDDVQALNVRRSVERAYDRLVNDGCGAVIVVAHSHGTVVAFDALTSRGPDGFPRVSKLVTLGAALNAAFDLAPECERLAGTLPPHIFWLDVWSYYDPVPGGALHRRRIRAPLVDPPAELRRRHHWRDDGPQPRQVTNFMNVATDHGAYWRNPEQFVGRLAQEIERPRSYYQESRFFFADEKERVRRRRVRIATLVGWRLAAMYLFALAVVTRQALGAADQLARDGRAIADASLALPGAALVAQVSGAVVAAVRDAGPTLASLGYGAIAVAAYAVAFALLYLLVTRFTFEPWNDHEAGDSVLPDIPASHPYLLVRTLATIAPLFLLAIAVATPR